MNSEGNHFRKGIWDSSGNCKITENHPSEGAPDPLFSLLKSHLGAEGRKIAYFIINLLDFYKAINLLQKKQETI